MRVPELPINPPEAPEVKIYCHECGEELDETDYVYEYKGTYIGCEYCITRKKAYEEASLYGKDI